jgi:hypothetical protein
VPPRRAASLLIAVRQRLSRFRDDPGTKQLSQHRDLRTLGTTGLDLALLRALND